MEVDNGPAVFNPEAGLRPRKRADLPLQEIAENRPFYQHEGNRPARGHGEIVKKGGRTYGSITDPTKRLAQYILDKALTPSNFSLQDFVRLDPRKLSDMVIEGIRVKADEEAMGPANATHVVLPVPAASTGLAVRDDVHKSVNAAFDASGIDYTFTWINASIGAVPVRAIVDTGSSISLISMTTVRKLGLLDCVDQHTSIEFFNAGGQKMVPHGALNDLPITMGPITQRHTFVVVDVDAYDVVLGIDFLGPLQVKIDMHDKALRVKMDPYTITTIPLHFGVGSVPKVNFMYCRQGDSDDEEPPPLETIEEDSSEEESGDENVDPSWPTEPEGDDETPAKVFPITNPHKEERVPLAPLRITAGSNSSEGSTEVSIGQHSAQSMDENLPAQVTTMPEQCTKWRSCGGRFDMVRSFRHEFPWQYGLMTEALVRHDFPAFEAMVARYMCVTSPWPQETNRSQIEQCSKEVDTSMIEESISIVDGRSLGTWDTVAKDRKVFMLHIQGKGGFDTARIVGTTLPSPEQCSVTELEQDGYVMEEGIPPHLQKDFAMLPMDEGSKVEEEVTLQIGMAAPPMIKHEFKSVMQTEYAALSSGIKGTEPEVHGTKVEHVIMLDPPNHPPISCKPYRMSPAMEEICRKQVEDMLEKGVIEPSASAWQFPVVMVKKKDGKTYRPCIDLRKLNAITRPLIYPMPHQDLILDKFSGARVWSLLDLEAGYWQVPLSSASRDYDHSSCLLVHIGLRRLHLDCVMDDE